LDSSSLQFIDHLNNIVVFLYVHTFSAEVYVFKLALAPYEV